LDTDPPYHEPGPLLRLLYFCPVIFNPVSGHNENARELHSQDLADDISYARIKGLTASGDKLPRNESAGQDFGKRRHTGPGLIPPRFGRPMHTGSQDSRFGQRRHTKAAVLISGRRDTKKN
jgi:hypothetical protein